MSTSQNGWPVIESGSSEYLTTIPKIIGKVRKDGGVDELFAHLVQWFDTKIEDVDRGRDDWGYNYRPIRGQESGFSNHASGTAIDLNAMIHPRGAINTFSEKQQAAIRKQMKDIYKNTVRWGGDYDLSKSKRDDMHFEIDASSDKIQAVLKSLGNPTDGESVKPQITPPSVPATPVKENSGNSKADNIAIARMLNYMGYDAGYPDGVPGPKLRDGVKAYQSHQIYFPNMKADGDWGPKTQAHYEWVKMMQDNVNDWKASKELGPLPEDGDYRALTGKHIATVQKVNIVLYRRAGGRVFDQVAGPIFCKMLGIPAHPSA